MIITIAAELTSEQIDIIASMKWYSPTVIENEIEIQNPQSPEDFIRSVYESLIKSDATRIFIDYGNKGKESARLLEEQGIRDLVSSSISSKIE